MYGDWVWARCCHPQLGSVIQAEDHGLPGKVLLVVVGRGENRPVPSLVERATLFALREADKLKPRTVALCSLGNSDKATGQRTIATLRAWLEESGRVNIQKPPRTRRVAPGWFTIPLRPRK